MAGNLGRIYENSSFIRLKDISLGYDLPKALIGKANISRLRFFAAPLLADFVKTTDDYIRTKAGNAVLRFTHAEAIAPFATY